MTNPGLQTAFLAVNSLASVRPMASAASFVGNVLALAIGQGLLFDFETKKISVHSVDPIRFRIANVEAAAPVQLTGI